MPYILNPTKLLYPYTTWTKVWSKVKNHIPNNPRETIRMEFTTKVEPYYLVGELTVVLWEFTIDYIRARVHEESEALPYMMTEEILRQAQHSTKMLDTMGLTALSKWLSTISEGEEIRIREGYMKGEDDI